jgi:hypothetical protein
LTNAARSVNGRAVEAGSITFQLIDEDGDELPGSWAYEWSGRDPLELAIFAVTELSGKPWKWSSIKAGRALLSPKKCRALSVRVGNQMRRARRGVTASVIARVISNEALRPGVPPPDAKQIARILAGGSAADWDAGPAQTTPAMLRALRHALRAARECEGGLRITWG